MKTLLEWCEGNKTLADNLHNRFVELKLPVDVLTEARPHFAVAFFEYKRLLLLVDLPDGSGYLEVLNSPVK